MRVEQKLYKNAYYQGTMSDDNAACILEILKETSMPALKNCIVNMTPEQMQELKDLYTNWEKEHGSVADIEDTFDYSKIAQGELRDEQTIGTAFMFYAGSCLLGDEVGLGKTVETAGLCNLVEAMNKKLGKPFSFCFLAEKASVEQIRNKMMQFTGHYIGVLENGEQKTVDAWIQANKDGQNYSIVGTHALLNNNDFLLYSVRHPFTIFIIDESALLKNNSSLVYKNAKAILSKQERKILLNATPLEKAVREFYNQLSLLDTGYMPTVAKFEADFCKKTKKGHGFEICGTKNEALFRQAVTLRYLARTRQLLGAKYEENTCTTYIVEPCHAQRELMRRSSLYQMIYDYPPDVDLRVESKIENIPKMRVCLEILKKIRERNPEEKTFVYCNYVNCQAKLAEVLEENGFKAVILNGKTKAKEKVKILDDFNNNKIYDVIITNVKRGLDLNICSNCIMYTIDHNPQKMVQAEGRMTRDFDVCYKNLYMIVMEGREAKTLDTSLKERVSMADNLTVTGNSMVMDAIRSNDKRIYIKTTT